MKRNILLVVGLLLVSMVASGCVAHVGNATCFWTSETELEAGNHAYVARGVEGSASCAYFMGIPLGDPDIYSVAQKELGVAYKTKGAANAYVNVTQQSSCINYILFGVRKVMLTADVIKFN